MIETCTLVIIATFSILYPTWKWLTVKQKAIASLSSSQHYDTLVVEPSQAEVNFGFTHSAQLREDCRQFFEIYANLADQINTNPGAFPLLPQALIDWLGFDSLEFWVRSPSQQRNDLLG